MEVKLRTATLEDQEALVILWQMLQDRHRNITSVYRERDPEVDEAIKTEVTTSLKNEKEQNIVATADGRVIGCINITTESFNTHLDAKKIGWIYRVVVLPEYRAKGIATMLSEEASRRFKADGVDLIRLTSLAGNTPAIKLYKKLGFEDFRLEMTKRL